MGNSIFYHISPLYDLDKFNNHEGFIEKFVPRIPKERLEGEDSTTPRVCISHKIEKCLQSFPYNGKPNIHLKVENEWREAIILAVHFFEIDEQNENFVDYSKLCWGKKTLVPDADFTQECWYKDTLIPIWYKYLIVEKNEFSSISDYRLNRMMDIAEYMFGDIKLNEELSLWLDKDYDNAFNGVLFKPIDS